MAQTVSEIIAEAAGKTAKDLGLDPEENAEQSSEEETPPEETSEETAEVDVEEGEAEVEPTSPKATKMVPIERFNEVYGKMKQMERYLAQVAAHQPERQAAPAPREEEIAMPEDLEDLTNKELFSLMRQVLTKDVKGALKEAVSPFSTFVGTVQQERADKEVAQVAAANADYFDYADQMVEIANRNPQLSAKEVYLLAKGDTAAVQKSVVKRVKAKMDQKKKANVEKRSTSVDKIDEKKEFKSVRDAGLAMAVKLGLK
jgi:hypothetical protein